MKPEDIDDTKAEIKATLKIRLYANSVLVAEHDDPCLWARILGCFPKYPPKQEQE
jgi:hypothetical protein